MDDTQIIDLYWQRSERAIAETDAKYGAYCRMVALNITGDTRDGEECVSDTWLAAWNSMPQARLAQPQYPRPHRAYGIHVRLRFILFSRTGGGTTASAGFCTGYVV